MGDSTHSPRIFIGREKELALLQKWMHGPDWFMVLTGDGGIGKSMLLERFAESQKTEAITIDPIDLYWTAHQTEIGILRSLAAQIREKTALSTPPQEGTDFSTFFSFIDKQDQTEDITYSARDAFLESYKNIKQKKILLVFDTLEVVSDAAIRFFAQTAHLLKKSNSNTHLLAAGREIPSDLASCSFVKKLALDGLHEIDFERYLAEAVSGRTISGEVIKHLYAITGGRPIWAGLFADWIRAGNSPKEIIGKEFWELKEAVILPIKKLEMPEDNVILAMAHLSRRCNEHLLSHVLSEEAAELGGDIPSILENLSRFSFVKYRKPVGEDSGTCLLHDEMRDLIRDYFWKEMDPFGNNRKRWSEKAIAFYNTEIDRLDTQSQVNDWDRHVLNAEKLFYLFHLNAKEAFDLYIALYADAKNTDTREELNSEVIKAQRAFRFSLSPPHQRQHLLRAAQVKHQRESHSAAIKLLEELNNYPECELPLLAEARWRLVMARTLQGELQQAIDTAKDWVIWLGDEIESETDGQKRQTLTQHLGSLCAQLGQAYRKRGLSADARGCYLKALELYSGLDDQAKAQIASTRVNLAFVYLEQGQTSEAFEECRTAYFIYSKLEEPYQLGRVYNVWGHVYDGLMRRSEAQECFAKALDAFQQARNKRGQCMSQIAQARMLRRQHFIERHDGVRPDAEESINNHRKIRELLDAAIENLTGKDPALLAMAHNEKANLLRELNQHDEAIEQFNCSNTIAESTGNQYRLADNFQGMARVYYNSGKFDLALQTAEQALKLAQDRYPQVIARTRRTIANILFDRGNYEDAFDAVRRSCTEIIKIDTESLSDNPLWKMGLYGDWLEWVLSLLSRLPNPEEKRLRIEQLIDTWKAGTMDDVPLAQIYPSFIVALKTLD